MPSTEVRQVYCRKPSCRKLSAWQITRPRQYGLSEQTLTTCGYHVGWAFGLMIPDDRPQYGPGSLSVSVCRHAGWVRGWNDDSAES